MKKILIKNCRLYDSLQEDTCIAADERILFCGPFEYALDYFGKDEKYDEIDAHGMIVTPGFIDIHNHGGGGFDFANADEEGTVQAIRAHLAKGTTTVLPTTASASTEMMLEMFETYRKVLAGPYGSCLGGIHLEGPFLNPAKKGAMPPHLLRLPEKKYYEPLLEAGSDIIKRFTIAPELPGAFELGDRLASLGIMVSAGHSEASSDVIKDASRHGFNLGTHIFNAMTSMHKEGIFRRPGVAESILSNDSYNVEAISDCIHIPPEILRMCWQIKGTRKMCLITDAISAAGLGIRDSEKYAFVDSYILVEDGVAKLPDRSAVAGSIACGSSMLKSALRAGIPFIDAVKMLTETPAKFCGFGDIGKILPGYRADLVILAEDNDVWKVIKGGKTVV